MTAQKFPFVIDGVRGDVPNNFYPATDSERGVILQPTPGLKELCHLPDSSEVRQMLAWNGYMYVVAQRGSMSALWRVDTGGGFEELGIISTSYSGPAWLFNNSTQLCVVDGVWGYVYTPSTGAFETIADLDFPGASSGDYQDGYGLFTKPNSNQWFFSALYNFKSFDALDFYSKESKPDNIVCLRSYQREPVIHGQGSTEVWFNAGGDNSSPLNPTFARNAGGVIEGYGIGAAGTSDTTTGTALVWLSDRGQLVTAAGYAAKPIDNQMFEREVKSYPRFDDAVAFSYREGGHVFYQISFPSAQRTWVLDLTTMIFHKRQSYLDDLTGYGRHRANCYALLNNKHYVGDYSNGKIYEMSTDYYDDDEHEIQRIVYTTEIEGGLVRLFFKDIYLIIDGGVNVPQGMDPQIMMDISNDGGRTWGAQPWQPAGKIGEYDRRAIWRQMGSSNRRMYRFTMTDPVLWRILSIDMGVKQ